MRIVSDAMHACYSLHACWPGSLDGPYACTIRSCFVLSLDRCVYPVLALMIYDYTRRWRINQQSVR